ncbi:hypothetical protein [uncultured Draconibacterium sp.]|uniref:hypothetical protein n=1 Tax=uncultured Draconibacterium sp. TaxID=1573823 RepID=UPI0025D5960C|nr:hypothetical protein [uncultured Draconibacterium sp.]
MFYEEINKKSRDECNAYMEEMVDGKPRYRWYKLALNSVYMIADLDDKFDIDHRSFSDLEVWYEAAEWVAVNDREALVHIMAELVPPVTDIVKQKLLEGLIREGHYKACAIVKQHLQSNPVPEERTFKRNKAKAVDCIKTRIVNILKGNCKQLEAIKNDHRDKLFSEDPEIQKALSVLVHIEFTLYGERLEESLRYLEWLRLNDPDELKQLFSISVSLEIKEQILSLLEKAELFHLYNIIDKCISIKPSSFYCHIQPYVRSSRDILGNYIDMDDD